MILPSSNTLTALCLIGFVLITLVLFAQVQYQNYNAKHIFWNRMNLFAAVVIAATLVSVVPQLFLVGRTRPQCYLLHAIAGLFFHLTNAMVRLFFLIRSERVVPLSPCQAVFRRCLLIAWLLNVSVSVVGMFLFMTVALVPPADVCIVVLDQAFVLVNSIVVPIGFDIVINARFLFHITQTSKATGMMNTPTRRLIRVTFLLCLSTMATSIVVACVLMGTIPLSERRLLTTVLALEQVYNACMMAWPAIIIRYMKNSEASASLNVAPVDDIDAKPEHFS